MGIAVATAGETATPEMEDKRKEDRSALLTGPACVLRFPSPLTGGDTRSVRCSDWLGHAATIAVVRCSSCLGLRTVSHRNRGSIALCPDCRRGEVIPRETFYAWWLEQFSAEECAAMARAI